MSIQVTITVDIPDAVSDIYQDKYIQQQLREKIGETMELPYPDDGDDTMEVVVMSVKTNWLGD